MVKKNPWIDFVSKDINDLEDESHYLVAYWILFSDSFSRPHLAYWDQSEGHFFSLENNNSHPIICDIYMEIPDFPERE